MPKKLEIGFHFIAVRSLRVLVIVKNVNFSIDGFGGDNFLFLRHVTSSIDFSLMINLNFNVDSSLFLMNYILSSYSIGVVIKDIFFIVSDIF